MVGFRHELEQYMTKVSIGLTGCKETGSFMSLPKHTCVHISMKSETTASIYTTTISPKERVQLIFLIFLIAPNCLEDVFQL